MVTTFIVLFTIFIGSINAENHYNILFVVADDLRTELGGPYGQNDYVYTPNLEAFMNRAFTFTHAYTQQAVCAATRASFLTGTRPDTTRNWGGSAYFRDSMINNTGKTVITLPEYFKKYGNYWTVGAGKIFHPGGASGGSGSIVSSCNFGDDMPYSWSEAYWDCDQSGDGMVRSPAQNGCINGIGCTQSNECLKCLSSWNCFNNVTNNKTSLVCPADCNDDCFNDYDIATKTLNYFQKIKSNETLKDKPWFIAAGLKRPHSAFIAPLRYFDMYGYNTNYSDIKIAKQRTAPYNMPIKATNNCSGVSKWPDVEPYRYTVNYTQNSTGDVNLIQYINDTYHSHLRAAYYSTITFLDEQFGRIIEGLYEYDFWNNTIVVFVGDHGFHLGEQGCWTKFTNFEVGTRVPLIIRIPNINEGKYSDILVEQLDMFPTLIDASGIGFNVNISEQLEGKSLLNIIKHPSEQPDFPQYAYSQFPRGNNIMGLSLRTTEWRYTEWLEFNRGSNISAPYPIWNELNGVELYNHSNSTVDENDMNAYDNYNYAYDENMTNIVNELHQILYETWDNQSCTY